MKRFLPKILIFLFVLLSTFYLLPSAVHAGTVSQPNNYPASNTNPDVPNTLHNWTQNVMIEVMSALTCQIAGVDPINPKQSCLGADQKTGKIGFISPSTGSGYSSGAIGFMGNMISVLYTPPLHTADYFQNLAQNFGISKKTYAAPSTGGTGFQSLTPLIGIWSAFRNIVYLILVIIFVVIGLAIMLRVKIDPRTVMTIQNQIPKIIVGILAVTFSFAIAGFLIDMMWVLIYLTFGIFTQIQIPGVSISGFNPSVIQGQNAIEVAGHISTTGIPGITFNITSGAGAVFKDIIGVEHCDSALKCVNAIFNPFNFVLKTSGIGFNVVDLLYDIISFIAGSAMFFKVVGIQPPNLGEGIHGISAFFQLVAEGGKAIAAGAIAGTVYASTQFFLREVLPSVIIYIIVFIALLVALFRLWFTLLMAYVEILLGVVLAPFWIIGGIVPGSPINLGGWFKNMAANLLAFPVTIAMFMLGRVFVDAFGTTQVQGQFVPPLIGNPNTTNAIGSLISLGILLMTPNVVNMLKAALKAPKIDASALTQGLGTGIGIPISTGKGIGATMMARGEYMVADDSGKWARRGLVRSVFGRLTGHG